jgi:hypothetical protein
MLSETQIQQRISDRLAEEVKAGKYEYWWLSFAAEDGFRGVIITEALGLSHALKKTHRLGINPGGEVRALPIPSGADRKFLDKKHHDKLLSREYMSANDLA